MKEYEVGESDYVDLWKHYQSRAESIKKSMFENTTWLLGFTSAILAFTIDNFITIERSGATATQPLIALVFCGAGSVLCGYTLFMLEEFGRHINNNWDDANYFKKSITEMPPDRKRSFLPGEIWHRLEFVVSLVLASFIIMGVFFINEV